jgi:hypothetical protein
MLGLEGGVACSLATPSTPGHHTTHALATIENIHWHCPTVKEPSDLLIMGRDLTSDQTRERTKSSLQIFPYCVSGESQLAGKRVSDAHIRMRTPRRS